MGSPAEEGLLIVVCDTGPLVSLSEAGLLDLLPLTGRVLIPQAVRAELLTIDPIPEWLEVRTLDDTSTHRAEAWIQAGLLDLGEAHSLELAKQESASWLLTDDTAARVVGQREGLEVHGSLGVVLWAVGQGHLERSAAEAGLEALAKSSLWVSERVLARAYDALDKLLS